jgi:hypothetical protein
MKNKYLLRRKVLQAFLGGRRRRRRRMNRRR